MLGCKAKNRVAERFSAISAMLEMLGQSAFSVSSTSPIKEFIMAQVTNKQLFDQGTELNSSIAKLTEVMTTGMSRVVEAIQHQQAPQQQQIANQAPQRMALQLDKNQYSYVARKFDNSSNKVNPNEQSHSENVRRALWEIMKRVAPVVSARKAEIQKGREYSTLSASEKKQLKDVGCNKNLVLAEAKELKFTAPEEVMTLNWYLWELTHRTRKSSFTMTRVASILKVTLSAK